MVIKTSDDFAKFVNQAMIDESVGPVVLSRREGCPTYRTVCAVRDGENSPQLINALGILDALGYEMCVVRKDEIVNKATNKNLME